MLTQGRVKELFKYVDGELVRRIGTSTRAKTGSISGSKHPTSYKITKVDGVVYYNHRIVWLYFYGYIPENNIDHVDRDKLNNKIENLREVSQSCNVRNTGVPINNTSTVKGVPLITKTGNWRSYIKINGGQKHLGTYCEMVNAVAARLCAEQCLGWGSCDVETSAIKFMNSYLENNCGKEQAMS